MFPVMPAPVNVPPLGLPVSAKGVELYSIKAGMLLTDTIGNGLTVTVN